MEDMELPEIPGSNARKNERTIIRSDQFTRKKLRGILHLITGELKARGTKTPHIFLPFRSRIDDAKLELFISKVFPRGELVSMFDEAEVIDILRKFDEFTLICGLKYLWSRLPNNEIIGWDVYLEYKRKEKEAGYPKGAFLSIMPKCLSSPAHASIVYDFLDLLISMASNSQYNYLSGRKIAKMSSLWAFNGTTKPHQSPFYDATLDKENTFIDGLEFWKPSSEALFHLLLSFLRAMLPENESDTLKLPKTLQSLLITNSYPPSESTDSIKSIITIPCVVIRSTKISSNVYELLSKVRNTISFNKKDSFLSIENYTILKNIFLKSSTKEIVSSLTEESRRILGRLDADPIESNYDLYPGWARPDIETDPDIPLFSQINIENVSLQDYYIWTWLSSLASDQTSHNKKLFGRSIVVEASLKGFQKWLIITEQVLSSEEYIKHFTEPSKSTDKRNLSSESYKNLPLPPPPPPVKENVGLLPKYRFNNDDFKMEIVSDNDDYIYPTEVNDDELSDYRRYLDSVNEQQDGELADAFKKTSLHSTDKKATYRPPPPPLESKEFSPTVSKYDQNPGQMQQNYDSSLQMHQPYHYENDIQHMRNTGPVPIHGQMNEPNPKKLSTSSAMSSSASQYLTPEGSNSPQKGIVSPYYSPNKFSQGHTDNTRFKEPYENYETEYERYLKLRNAKSDEPFDDYHIEGFERGKMDHEHAPGAQPMNYDMPLTQSSPVSNKLNPSLTLNRETNAESREPETQHEQSNGNIPLVRDSQEEHELPPVPQQLTFQDQAVPDYNNEQSSMDNSNIAPISDLRLPTENQHKPNLEFNKGLTREEKKKRKHKKKKGQQSPSHIDSERFDEYQPSPYGMLPPGPPPPLDNMPTGPLPPHSMGIMPQFLPPGPPPGIEQPINEPFDQTKKKEKGRRKKKQEKSTQENMIDPPTVEREQVRSPQTDEPIWNTINQIPANVIPNDPPTLNPVKNTQYRNTQSPVIRRNEEVLQGAPPKNRFGNSNDQSIPQAVPQISTSTPHISVNDYQNGPQEPKAQNYPQQYPPKSHYGHSMPSNSPHSSHSVPHITAPPTLHPGSQSAPHLPIHSERANNVPHSRMEPSYQNGTVPTNNFYPQHGYPQNGPAQYQQPVYHAPPPNSQYFQPPPGPNSMGQYNAPSTNQPYYPPGPQNYYPPPQSMPSPRMNNKHYGNPAPNNLPMMNVPSGVRSKKNGKTSKADLRAAFNQGTFGI